MSESKSLLARLLAKENITVRHGNYKTAYFNVKDRILGLPLWKDDDKDLHDMLVGHEVGHALYTPADGWINIQQASKDTRIPGDYLNVVEDIRIERKIQSQYPGIVRSFKKGYSYLSESDFFGLEGRDPNTMSLMDRINLKAKLRDLIDIDFSTEEKPLVDQAFAAETWDEVVEAARDLYDYVRQSRNSEKSETIQDLIESGNKDPNDTEEQYGEEETSNDQEDDENDESFDDQSTDIDSESEAESTDEEEDGAAAGSTARSGVTEEDLENEKVETYQNSLKNQHDLLEKNDKGDIPSIVYGLTREQMESMIIPFDKVRDSRIEARNREIEQIHSSSYCSDEWKTERIKNMNTENQFKEFINETKRVVNTMVKEFEIRKAAHQYSRATTSRSGSLDMNRLHEYKINDDIFQRVTTLADAKSHGMVMLIDNSGSMQYELGDVISQVLNLAMFCKRVNIPFDVYSFTSTSMITPSENGEYIKLYDESIDHNDILVTHILSSSFSRKDYDVAYRQLFDIAKGGYWAKGDYDRMGGTPLNDVLSGMHIKLKDFKQKHQVQKVIFVVLTDGDSNVFNTKAYQSRYSPVDIRVLLSESRKTLSLYRMYHTISATQKILDALRSEVPGLINIGYFVASNSNNFKTAVNRATGEYGIFEAVKEARKIANRDKFVSYDSTLGYDRYFVLKATGSNLDVSTDEFKVSATAKRGEITRAFKKYAKSKKGNRVLATQFAEIVS